MACYTVPLGKDHSVGEPVVAQICLCLIHRHSSPNELSVSYTLQCLFLLCPLLYFHLGNGQAHAIELLYNILNPVACETATILVSIAGYRPMSKSLSRGLMLDMLRPSSLEAKWQLIGGPSDQVLHRLQLSVRKFHALTCCTKTLRRVPRASPTSNS